MDKNNNRPKRTFIPQSIGDTVKKINRKFTTKYGKLDYIIHSNWPKIVGTYFKEFSEPKNISRVQDYENDLGEKIYRNYLNVNVAPAAALEFQHFNDKIVEKINSFFGYQAIKGLRINQNYIPKNNISIKYKPDNKMMSKNDEKEIENELKSIDNIDLKKSLIKLKIDISNKRE